MATPPRAMAVADPDDWLYFAHASVVDQGSGELQVLATVVDEVRRTRVPVTGLTVEFVHEDNPDQPVVTTTNDAGHATHRYSGTCMHNPIEVVFRDAAGAELARQAPTRRDCFTAWDGFPVVDAGSNRRHDWLLFVGEPWEAGTYVHVSRSRGDGTIARRKAVVGEYGTVELRFRDRNGNRRTSYEMMAGGYAWETGVRVR